VATVLVLNYGEPLQRLMGWFLRDSGLDAVEATEVDEATEIIRTNPVRAVVVNSCESLEALAEVVDKLRETIADARIIVLHRGGHVEGEPPINADLCIHDPDSPEYLVQAVQAAVGDRLPEIEPHEAAEEIP